MDIFWHRRDLRVSDNSALYKALTEGENIQPIFIFDKHILDELPKDDQRVVFIHKYISELKEKYQKVGSDLWVFYSTPKEVFKKIIAEHEVSCVFTNRDYEPYAIKRDKSIYELLDNKNIKFKGAKDHVIFEKGEVVKDDGSPYKVFTPYMKKWKAVLKSNSFEPYTTEAVVSNLNRTSYSTDLPTLKQMGFLDKQRVEFPSSEVSINVISNYHENRDIPSKEGTSRMSVHLRFGTVSIRGLAKLAQKNEKYLNELIWRDFYQMIIYHFPESVNNAFKQKYDAIPWDNNKEHFVKWCEGKTGYPIVDAGMRELNNTGFMHNRVRMIVASFLTKHLLIDWRWGEAYFAEKLLDFELASNVGGWQWAASSGVDAQPYFRVFNPYSQQEKFDKTYSYIKKWVPEFGNSSYPNPIVEHKSARKKAIEVYKNAIN